jgi:hypothetical protein
MADRSPSAGRSRARLSASDRMRRVLRRALGDRISTAVRAVLLLARGRELRAPFPLWAKLAAWTHGFRAESVALYDFTRNDRRDYLTDYARRSRCGALNPTRALLDNKLMMHLFLLSKGLPQAETVAVVSGGDAQLFPLDERSRRLSTADRPAA